MVTSTLKTRIKRSIKSARSSYAKAFRVFSPSDLDAALRNLGVRAGDTLLVHSSYDAFAGFAGKPTDVLGVLQRLVTADGNLVLPTLPFTGTAIDYARTSPVFDPLRTPSRTGLLTELFRRSPDVVRSVHPTHSAAVWGRDAAAIAEDHHLAHTPCGIGTPYAQVLDRNGKILLLGADIRALTLYHTIEELLEERFPVSPFTSETYCLHSRSHDGATLRTETRLYDSSVSRRRNLARLVSPLKQRGAWRETRVGGMSIVLLHARDVLDTVRAMADEGVFCYDL